MENNNNNSNSDEDSLWQKYRKFQKRLEEKSTHYNSSIKYLKDIRTEIDRHSINLTLINSESKMKKSTILEIDEIFNLFLDSMKAILENHKKLIQVIILHLEKYISSIKKESPIYNEFKQFFHTYQNEQKKFNQIKEKFLESALEVENKTLKLVQKKNEKKISQPIDLSKKLKKEVKQNLKKYQTSIDEINKKTEEYKSKKNHLIQYFVAIESNESFMYKSILKEFWKCELEKTIEYFYQDKFVKWKEKTKNDSKDIDKEQNEVLNKLKNNETKEKKKSFEYKSNIDFDKCLEEGDFNTYAETVDIIKKNFDIIYEDITLEKEKLKNNIRELIKKFFEFDEIDRFSEVKEDELNLYFNSLKDKSTHNTFIKIITKFRTNSKFNRGKLLIEILGKSFSIIMEEAEKTQNFWTAKNCIILSQTFFYEKKQENNTIKKIYPFEFLKIKSWLVKKNFWAGYTILLVEEEFKKFAEFFDDINFEDIINNKEFSKKINNKISDILFSQILPSITNMLLCINNKMDAVELIELFHEKYRYLSEDKIQGLYLAISSDEEEIQKMKEEYKLHKKDYIMKELENEKINQNNINDNKEIDKINNISEIKIINNEKENIINKEKEDSNIMNEAENKNKIIMNESEEERKNSIIINNDKEENNKMSEEERKNSIIINNDKEESNKMTEEEDTNKNILNNDKEENNKMSEEENKNKIIINNDKEESYKIIVNDKDESINMIDDLDKNKKEEEKNIINKENKIKKEDENFFKEFEFILDNNIKNDNGKKIEDSSNKHN